MTVTAHGSRRVYSGATRPSPFHLPTITLTDADRAPIPLLERCTYEQFLQLLVDQHGTSYLCRPDGTALAGVVAIPQPRQTVRKVVQAPIDIKALVATPEPQPEPPSPIVSTHYAHVGELRRQISDALAAGPLIMTAIVARTSLSVKQVRSALTAGKDKYYRKLGNANKNNLWELIKDPQVAPESPDDGMINRERIEAHITTKGRSTSRQLADALGLPLRTVQGALYSSHSNRVKKVGTVGNKTILWGFE